MSSVMAGGLSCFCNARGMHKSGSSCWQLYMHKQESGREGWIANKWSAGNSRSSEEKVHKGEGWWKKRQRKRHDVE